MLNKIVTVVFSVIMILAIVPNETLASNHNDTTYRFNLTTHNDAKRTPARAKKTPHLRM
ncbi:hypothetical protein [Amphibacillus indicireducens]|uniref:Uncharacterized protein n=1 Tax=Amphibacillus indicireducens TaxID=1076330 RepID=A0ABP7V626_9BACI